MIISDDFLKYESKKYLNKPYRSDIQQMLKKHPIYLRLQYYIHLR